MNERIKAHLDSLFEGAPKSRRVEEMRQELLAGCLDKYADLIGGGMNGEEAYNRVIDGIGDVSELIGYVERTAAFNPADAAEKRQKRAFFTSAGICGYFIAAAVLVLLGRYGMTEVALAAGIIIAGISTMLILYARMTSVAGPYEKADDTLVEEMKAQMMHTEARENKMASLVSSTLWAIVVTIYLGASFLTMWWHVTWIIFPFAASLQSLVLAYFFPAQRQKHLTGALWTFATTVYLIISFWSNAWYITWLVFPITAAVQQASRLYLYWREME